jgi:energy-converting hydrogenase Eha subunit B
VRLASAGLAGGILAALAVTLLIRPTADPAMSASIAALLHAIALVACLVPVIRVTGVTPATALRHE